MNQQQQQQEWNIQNLKSHYISQLQAFGLNNMTAREYENKIWMQSNKDLNTYKTQMETFIANFPKRMNRPQNQPGNMIFRGYPYGNQVMNPSYSGIGSMLPINKKQQVGTKTPQMKNGNLTRKFYKIPGNNNNIIPIQGTMPIVQNLQQNTMKHNTMGQMPNGLIMGQNQSGTHSSGGMTHITQISNLHNIQPSGITQTITSLQQPTGSHVNQGTLGMGHIQPKTKTTIPHINQPNPINNNNIKSQPVNKKNYGTKTPTSK